MAFYLAANPICICTFLEPYAKIVSLLPFGWCGFFLLYTALLDIVLWHFSFRPFRLPVRFLPKSSLYFTLFTTFSTTTTTSTYFAYSKPSLICPFRRQPNTKTLLAPFKTAVPRMGPKAGGPGKRNGVICLDGKLDQGPKPVYMLQKVVTVWEAGPQPPVFPWCAPALAAQPL